VNAPRLPWLERAVPPGVLRREGLLVCLAGWGLLLLVPLSLGEFGLGSDALNHHIYLGWTAERPRFDRDFLAAGYQSLVSPYLFWPEYRMAAAGWSGAAAGAALATLQAIVLAPVWMLARACVPGGTVFDFTMRALAVVLAFASCVVLAPFTVSMNDLLAAAPLVWAVALALEPAVRPGAIPPAVAMRYVLWSGLAAGLSVALKLSNGPLVVAMPLLWLLCARGWRGRLAAALGGSFAAGVGFLLGYGYWGWLLWRHFGNPIYPFYDHWFAPLRAWLGWAG
jgi:hypothetical protein